MNDSVTSVLHAAHQGRGADFVVYSGWTWVTTFGDVDAEYAAIRNGVSMWDVYGLQKFDVSGPDSAMAIQTVFANDVLGMPVGRVRYGAFVNETGAIVDDGTVFKLADDHFWVMANSVSTGDYIREHAHGMDASITFRTHEMPDISLQGPGSRELLQRLTTIDLAGLRYYQFLPERVTVAGVPVWLLRTGFTGDLGFELIPDQDDAVTLWNRLADEGAVPVGVDAVGIARIEAGFVIIGNDYEPYESSPFDVSMDRVTATDKDLPVIGMDALRAAAASPSRRLKTLRVAGVALPEAGASVRQGDRIVGTLTSPALSPSLGVIGLAVLETPASGDGTILSVDLPSGTAEAVVDCLSIIDPSRSLRTS